MNRLKELVNRHSSGKKVLLLFIVTNLVYAFMLVISIPKVMESSKGMELLDMKPTGYDAAYIDELFGTLGEIGRDDYLYKQLPVDMIYPFLFGISFCLLLAYFLKKINKFNSGLFYLCFLPIIGGIADYFENFGIISLLITYPDLSKTVMSMTNVFSVVKSMSTTVYFIVLLITMIVFGIQVLTRKKTSADNG